jgi:hypothetical protein
MKPRKLLCMIAALALTTVILAGCVSTQIGSTNFINEGVYAVTITGSVSDSDEALARLAASSIGVAPPFAYGYCQSCHKI